MKHCYSVLYVQNTILDYLEPVMPQIFLKCGFRRDLSLFSQEHSCTIAMEFSMFYACMRQIQFTYNCRSPYGNKVAILKNTLNTSFSSDIVTIHVNSRTLETLRCHVKHENGITYLDLL